ncbi:MAG: BLUF domain-containing protein [Amphritea sp.]|nr:BLUF domain-containing protein [Amphritea sp.]
MELVHSMYCSVAKDPELSSESLEEILEQSRTNNARQNITGILLFDSGSFFQVLEGDREQIEALLKRIKFDSRHTQMTLLITEPIEERSFGEWSMGYPKVTKEDLQSISGLNDFFAAGQSFMQLEQGRAKTLLEAFKKGRWHL